MRNILRKIPTLLMCLLCAAGAAAEQWRLHPTYDGNILSLIDSPDNLYILSYNQPLIPGTADYSNISASLFRYDKEAEELTLMNRSNTLSGNVLQRAAYNVGKDYLLAVHDSGDIDLLYDDGHTVNIPGFRLAGSNFARTVNDIEFDPASDMAYLATDFGILAINDRKGEIAYTRNYGERIRDVLMHKGRIYLLTDNGIVRGKPSEASLGGFESFCTLPALQKMVALGDRIYIWNGNGSDGHIWYSDPETPANNYLTPAAILSMQPVGDNLLVIAADEILRIDGKTYGMTRTPRPEQDLGKAAASCDGRSFWTDNGRQGVALRRMNGSSWTTRIENIRPDASAAFISDNLRWHENYGMLVRNHGNSLLFTTLGKTVPDLLSALRGLEWKNISNVYSGNYRPELDVYNPKGVLVDPDNPDRIYCGSMLDGLLVYDTSDPSKSLRVTRANDEHAGKTGVVAVEEVQDKMSNLCSFQPGGFDSNRVFWTAFYSMNRADKEQHGLELRYWTADDRKAITGPSAYRPMKRIPLDRTAGASGAKVFPLTASRSRNMLVITGADNNWSVSLFDHNGTPDNTSDDTFVNFNQVYDQDGSPIDMQYLYCVYEDPATGNVWIGNDNGVYWFDPAEAIKNPGHVNRVKVARNDGTNLADHLLNATAVTGMTTDRNGYRWFATNGGGVVCTSANGTEIRKTYTAANSMLPDDVVYGICYNPDNNSMMMSTASGLAELYLSGAGGTDDGGDAIKAYPNPVRPEWYGFVTIEGLPDGAVVKVTDSAGNLVRELEPAAGGETRWDVTNSSNRRVPAGVYRILASGTAGDGNFAASTKVLVIK